MMKLVTFLGKTSSPPRDYSLPRRRGRRLRALSLGRVTEITTAGSPVLALRSPAKSSGLSATDSVNAQPRQHLLQRFGMEVQFSYSAVMRKIRAKCNPEQVRQFLALFKVQFDRAVKGKLHKPERVALQTAMVKFNKMHKVKIDQKMIKNAAISELGNSEQVGQYLSDIVKFVLNRLPLDKRQHAVDSLKQKFSVMSELDISSKVLPQSSALGQSITFVKTVLFNHDARYVREVLNSLVKHL